ncbi:P-loop NTPase fold protein [Psychrobacter pacificensis]|jgi:hypothetical protein|uniref:P-loop NTPase fold protein n=3 Tax=Psychrobacter TaxID=497 RepID=UPI001BAF4570|tara:strand:- start:6275 stop:8119 length:1845 start_codon:yes stop_codon:yes gene_type:complete
MANVENLEKRLIDLIDEESSFAIALTGEWGIGKTRFWNDFYEENHINLGVNKYSYVSLFGIDSIEALKFEIALSTHETTQKKDYLSGLKGIFKKSLDAIDLPKLEGAGVSLSLGKGLISSAITSLIGDTLVCIDDIERLSKNLDIKDVMGLVNHLSLEKNCKVVVILHEGKADKKFREYKEKVFDEVLVLDDSLSIIKDKISDVDTFPIYEKFYQTMGVRNLRFYQRVQKIYQEIIKHSSDLSELSKEEILRQILIIKLVNDIPKVLDVDMKELETYFSEDGLDDRLDIFLKSDDEALKPPVRTKKDDVEKKLSKFYPNFRMEGWAKIIIELITNIDVDHEKFESLLEQDLITEQNLENDRENKNLMAEYRNLDSDQSFNQRLFDNIKDRIDREAFPNLSLYYNILEKNGSPELAKKFEELVKQYIEDKVKKGPSEWFIGDYYLRIPVPPDIFYKFLLQTISNQKKGLALNTDASTLSEIFMRFCKHGNDSEDFFEAIQNISKENFSSVVWQPLDDGIDRIRYIRELLKHPAFKVEVAKFNNGDRIDTAIWHYRELVNAQKLPPFYYQPFLIESKLNEVKQWTLELLQERSIEKPNSKAAIEHFLELTNNLESI